MSYEAIARRWATAVFEIGKSTNTVAQLNADLAAFAETYAGNAELSSVLDNPLVPGPAREAVIVEIATRMGLSETAKNTLRLLAQKRRLRAVPDLARQLARLADDDEHLLRAEVTSAGPLSEDNLQRLRSELEKATGKKVVVTHRQDSSLIAGVVTRIGDKVIDGSARTRLRAFRESLLRT